MKKNLRRSASSGNGSPETSSYPVHPSITGFSAPFEGIGSSRARRQKTFPLNDRRQGPSVAADDGGRQQHEPLSHLQDPSAFLPMNRLSAAVAHQLSKIPGPNSVKNNGNSSKRILFLNSSYASVGDIPAATQPSEVASVDTVVSVDVKKAKAQPKTSAFGVGRRKRNLAFKQESQGCSTQNSIPLTERSRENHSRGSSHITGGNHYNSNGITSKPNTRSSNCDSDTKTSGSIVTSFNTDVESGLLLPAQDLYSASSRSACPNIDISPPSPVSPGESFVATAPFRNKHRSQGQGQHQALHQVPIGLTFSGRMRSASSFWNQVMIPCRSNTGGGLVTSTNSDGSMRTTVHHSSGAGRQRIPSVKEFPGDCSMLEALRPALILAQLFALLPLDNVTSRDFQDMTFSFASPKFAYSGVVTLGIGFLTCVATQQMLGHFAGGSHFANASRSWEIKNVMFYGYSFFASILLIHSATKFREWMHAWQRSEVRLNRYGFEARSLKGTFRVIIAALLISSTIEHTLSMLQIDVLPWGEAPDENLTLRTYLLNYCNATHRFIYDPFGEWACYFAFGVNKFATFYWNFVDLLLMLVSVALARKFRHINAFIKRSVFTHWSAEDWKRVRQDHLETSFLVRSTDRIFSPIVLISYINNIFFVCMQLLSGLTPTTGGVMRKLYFTWSFLHLVIRALAVSIAAARIHDESQEAIEFVHKCPNSEIYNSETRRFLDHIVTYPVGLTGSGLFLITRTFILGIVSAVVTYEMVLLQFDS